MSLPTVVFLLPAAVCALSWYGAAAWLPARWLPVDALAALLTRVAAGTIVTATVVFALGRAGVFHEWLLDGLTIALAAVGAVSAVRLRPRLTLPPQRLVRVLLVLVAVALLLDVVAAAAPPTSGDALKYHLTLPDRWLEIGSIDDPFWRYEAFSPFALEMLYAQALSLAGA